MKLSSYDKSDFDKQLNFIQHLSRQENKSHEEKGLRYEIEALQIITLQDLTNKLPEYNKITVEMLFAQRKHIWDSMNDHQCIKKICNCISFQIKGEYFHPLYHEFRIAKGDIYVCPITGKVHICNSLKCKNYVQDHWHGKICTITGNYIGSHFTSLNFIPRKGKNDDDDNNNNNDNQPNFSNYEQSGSNYSYYCDEDLLLNNDKKKKTFRRKKITPEIKLNRLKNPLKRHSSYYHHSGNANVSEIQTLVHKLLFSNESNDIRKKKISKLEHNADKSIKSYYKQQIKIKTMPIDVITYIIYMDETQGFIRNKVIVYDQRRENYYVGMILKAWHILLDTPYARTHTDEFNIKSHTLGFLYFLAEGKYVKTRLIDSVELIPKDEFIRNHLPSFNELKFFSIVGKAVTSGKALINESFKSAIRSAKKEKDIKMLCIKNFVEPFV